MSDFVDNYEDTYSFSNRRGRRGERKEDMNSDGEDGDDEDTHSFSNRRGRRGERKEDMDSDGDDEDTHSFSNRRGRRGERKEDIDSDGDDEDDKDEDMDSNVEVRSENENRFITIYHPSFLNCDVKECEYCSIRDCPSSNTNHYNSNGCPDCDNYEVEKIIRYSKSRGKYKVKWVGYSETTWEPRENLEGCVIFQTWEAKRKKKDRTAKKRAMKGIRRVLKDEESDEEKE
jgi:hypothetical protein